MFDQSFVDGGGAAKAIGDSRLARDVGDPSTVIAQAREHPNRGVHDPVALVAPNGRLGLRLG